MRFVYAIVLVVLALGVGLFCIQNLKTVSLMFLNWELTIPLAVLVLVLYFLGMATGCGLLSFIRKSIRGATDSHKE